MAIPDEDARARLLRPRTDERHPVVAGWLAVVLTGFGHMYAREYARGVLLLASEVVALSALGTEDVLPPPVRLGALLWLAFLIYGIVDAVKAVRIGDPRPPSGAFWLFPAVAVVASAVALLG